MASPVAGLRPIRAGRFLTCKMAKPAILIFFAFLEMLGDLLNEVSKECFTLPL